MFNYFLKVIIICMFILIATSVYASQTWIPFSSDFVNEPNIELKKSDTDSVNIETEIKGMLSEDIIVNSTEYQKLKIPGWQNLHITGDPDLPVFNTIIAIPECDDFSVNIIITESIVLEDYNVYPAPEFVDNEEIFTINDSLYAANEFYPSINFELISTGYFRDQKYTEINFYPVHFNPVTNQLEIITLFEIQLTFVNPTTQINVNTGIFNNIASNFFLNYNSSGISATYNNNPGTTGDVTWLQMDSQSDAEGLIVDYLIITLSDFFDSEDPDNFVNQLADHRANFNSFDIVIANVDNVLGIFIDGNDPQLVQNERALRRFIERIYDTGTANNTLDDKLGYVLLVGDVHENNTGIPTSYDHQYLYNGPEPNDIYPSDYYFSCVTENGTEFDEVGDLFIGRFSVDTQTELQACVDKTINHETETEPADWRSNVLLAAHWSEYSSNPYYASACEAAGYIPESYNITYAVGEYEEDEEDTQTIINTINDGALIVGYWGHGSETYWSTTFYYDDFTQLNNLDKSLYVLTSACHTGRFDWNDGDCMAEYFLNTPGKGAFGYLGAGRGSPHGNFLNGKVIISIFEDNCFVTGENILDAKLQSSIRYRYIYNYFGDPALNIFMTDGLWTLPDISVSMNDITITPEEIYVGDIINIEVTISNISSQPAPPSIAHLYVGENLIDANEFDTINLDTIGDYDQVIISSTLNTSNIHSDDYNIYIWVETAYAERFLQNNSSSKGFDLYNDFMPGFPVNDVNGIHPVAFDLNSENPGKEIISIGSIISNDGSFISHYTGDNLENLNYNSVGNLDENNDTFEYICFTRTRPNNYHLNKVDAYGNMSELHTFSFPEQGTNSISGPFLADIDDNGTEEIFLVSNSTDTDNFLHCLYNNGNIIWSYSFGTEEIFEPIIIRRPDGHNYIVVPAVNHIYQIDANGGNQETLYTADTGWSILSKVISSDLDLDGYIDLVFCVNNQIDYELVKLENDIFQSAIIDTLYENSFSLYFADLDNNRTSEIILSDSFNNTIYIFQYNLTYNILDIENLDSPNILIGDYDNDDQNDIFYYSSFRENIFSPLKKYIRVIDSDGNEIEFFYVRLHSEWNYPFIANINEENSLELIFNSSDKIYAFSLPETGSLVACNGSRGNLRNTGIYLQPAYISDSTPQTFWYNNILLHQELDVADNYELIIQPDSKVLTLYKSKITILGSFISNGKQNHPICYSFYGSDEENWTGCRFLPRSVVTISFSEIINADIALYGFQSSLSICDNQISKNNIGISLDDCPYVTISRNTIEDNFSHAIDILNSSPILEENIIISNFLKGIYIADRSFPVMDFDSYNTLSNNGYIEIEMIWGFPLMVNGHNDLIHNYDGYIMYSNGNFGGDRSMVCKGNWWGSYPLNPQRFYPDLNGYYVWDPADQESNSNIEATISEARIAFNAAYALEINEEYEQAIIAYKEVIEDYPNTNEALVSAQRIFYCEQIVNSRSFSELQEYYQNLSEEASEDTLLSIVARNLSIKCKVEQEQFSEALNDYENILLSNPTLIDSVFTSINIMNTFLLADMYGLRFFDNISEYILSKKPRNFEDYNIKKWELLSRISCSLDQFDNSIPDFDRIKLYNNYPNPFNPTTTISFSIPEDSKVNLSIYNIKGQKVKTLSDSKFERGIHKLIWDSKDSNGKAVSSGIYFYKLKVNDKSKAVKKMLLLK
jgi:parallel beta-helix repeat protein